LEYELQDSELGYDTEILHSKCTLVLTSPETSMQLGCMGSSQLCPVPQRDPL